MLGLFETKEKDAEGTGKELEEETNACVSACPVVGPHNPVPTSSSMAGRA